MFGIGVQELVVIFVVALLIFGPKRLPELARGLGKGLAEFRKASGELRQSFMLEVDQAERRSTTADPRSVREPVGKPDQLVDAPAPAASAPSTAASASEPAPSTNGDPASGADERGRA
jgi:TatA/E family protein of Tat protein translocase